MNTGEIQKVFKWVWVVLIILAAFLAVETLGSLKDLRSINPAYNSISVTGEGEAISIPDIATFSFSVSADAQAVSDAQGQVTEKMNVILEELKSFGIEERDIKTIGYSVWPKYRYEPAVCAPTYCPPPRQVPDGYTANHNVLVKIRRTEEAGRVLALVGEKGATGLSDISFTIDDMDGIMQEARTEAIKDAQDKAEALAEELGIRLVRVVSFYDNTGGMIPYYAEGMGGDTVRTAAPVPDIPAGENKVKVNVTVTYEIR